MDGAMREIYINTWIQTFAKINLLVNKITLFFLQLLVACCLISCKKEKCHDLNYGDQYLEPISLTFESGANAKAIIFKDSDGNDHRFELSTELYLLHSNIHQSSCEGELIAINHQSEYYARRFLAQNNTAIAYVQIVDFLDEEENFDKNRLVDILKLSVFNDNAPPNPLSRICIMTSSRESNIDQESYNSDQFTMHDSLVLLNKTFYGVFEQKQGATKMYYTQIDGIVSFTDNAGVQLILDRIE